MIETAKITWNQSYFWLSSSSSHPLPRGLVKRRTVNWILCQLSMVSSDFLFAKFKFCVLLSIRMENEHRFQFLHFNRISFNIEQFACWEKRVHFCQSVGVLRARIVWMEWISISEGYRSCESQFKWNNVFCERYHWVVGKPTEKNGRIAMWPKNGNWCEWVHLEMCGHALNSKNRRRKKTAMINQILLDNVSLMLQVMVKCARWQFSLNTVKLLVDDSPQLFSYITSRIFA